MLVAKVFPLTVLFLVSFASKERDFSREFRPHDNDRSSRLEESQEEHFEQCHRVNAWTKQLGHVSVLAFLDFTWQYSVRQAVMLRVLGSRLRKSGFSDIRFFVITPPFDLGEDGTEDTEIEVWGEIASMSENLKSVDDRLPRDESEIIFLQDDAQSRIWQRFRASKDQVAVIDRCGRLTYQVIIPWSILYFPYVKAAILSTYKDDPCGGCDPTVYQAYFSSAVNNTDKEADPSKTADDVNADLIWKMASVDNFAIDYNESSEENREASTVSAVVLAGAADNTGDAREFSSATAGTTRSEAAYQYDSATESSFRESNADAGRTRNQEEAIYSQNSTVPVAETQRDVSPKQEETAYTRTSSVDDDAVTSSYAETTETDSISTAKTTTSYAADDDGARETAGNADVNSDGADKREQDESVDANVASKENRVEQNPLPLRIIMQAPHLHRSGQKMKKYKYLILRVDDPNFHEHLGSGIDVKPWQDAGIEAKSTGEQEAVGTNTDKEDADQNYTFDVDEGPGLYGEVADFWKSLEDNDITDENKPRKSTIKYYEETKEDESSEMARINKQEKEMEMRYKLLIEHYSKFLPWIFHELKK